MLRGDIIEAKLKYYGHQISQKFRSVDDFELLDEKHFSFTFSTILWPHSSKQVYPFCTHFLSLFSPIFSIFFSQKFLTAFFIHSSNNVYPFCTHFFTHFYALFFPIFNLFFQLLFNIFSRYYFLDHVPSIFIFLLFFPPLFRLVLINFLPIFLTFHSTNFSPLFYNSFFKHAYFMS